jgi:hypothetical protein
MISIGINILRKSLVEVNEVVEKYKQTIHDMMK